MTKTAPESYLDARRPLLIEALRLEGGSLGEAMVALERKGYFAPPPRPWRLGQRDRGNGHYDWAVLDRFGDVVVPVETRETAEFIIEAANAKG